MISLQTNLTKRGEEGQLNVLPLFHVKTLKKIDPKKLWIPFSLWGINHINMILVKRLTDVSGEVNLEVEVSKRKVGNNMPIRIFPSKDELMLCYEPDNGFDDISIKLDKNRQYRIKNTYTMYRERTLVDGMEECYDDKIEKSNERPSFTFPIGRSLGDYYRLDQGVFETEHIFFVSRDVTIDNMFFVAIKNISILKRIDEIVRDNVYIGGIEREDATYIPTELYKNLIKSFPNHLELLKYSKNRIATILQEVLVGSESFREKYESYIHKKEKMIFSSVPVFEYAEVELLQFKNARDELHFMLDHSKDYLECDWQRKIQSIIRLVYPKYILFEREIELSGTDGYGKRPDYLLVDNVGFVDLLELKSPNVEVLSSKPRYRNNYIPQREFSGAIQQIEKYIYCLSTIENNRKYVENKLKPKLPKGMEIKIINPAGILLAGRSNEFDERQKKDFELIKRQYKNIVDIMTYDDLLNRIDNIIEALKSERGIVDKDKENDYKV